RPAHGRGAMAGGRVAPGREPAGPFGARPGMRITLLLLLDARGGPAVKRTVRSPRSRGEEWDDRGHAAGPRPERSGRRLPAVATDRAGRDGRSHRAAAAAGHSTIGRARSRDDWRPG